MTCPLGCLRPGCHYAASCAAIGRPHRLPVGHLRETDLGRRVCLPVAGRAPLEGVLTGLWPFTDDATVLRISPPVSSPALHLVHDAIELEVW